jgi:adenine-specific DNA-methyltransferase
MSIFYVEVIKIILKLNKEGIMEINNRRYLGNKYKLLPFIKEVVESECSDIQTVFDVFSGTGSVASAFVDKTIIVNDILYNNHLAHITWFSPETYDKEKIQNIIKAYNSLGSIKEENYMSEHFSDTYFSRDVCLRIGYIREDIEKKFLTNEINKKEKAILITSLLYAMDKIATTCGHYDAYRKGIKHNDNFILEMPNMFESLSLNNKCYNTDSNELAKDIVCDLAYLDPPYNSRQYCDAYHLLENVAKWEKPEVKGVAKKMDRSHLKSDYCTNKATATFEELILRLKCKYILLSYNNTGDTANDRSNAKLTDKDIIRILSRRGTVKVFSKSYKAFTTGKSENNKNEERLFLCIVEDKNMPSPLNYTGGKAKLLPQIKPLFPKNISNMVDLFCGGATVGANVLAKKNYYNDKTEPLIGLLKTFTHTPVDDFITLIDSIIEEYTLSNSTRYGYEYYNCNSSTGLGNYNRDKFIKLKNDFNTWEQKDEKYYGMFFVLIVYAFNNQIRFNTAGEFNLPVGKRDFNNNIRKKLKDFMLRLNQQNTEFSSVSFEDFDISILDKDSFVYCDPPYLISTASYNENGGWTEDNERRLLEFLDKLNDNGIKFALSNVIVHKGKKNEILEQWVQNKTYKIHNLNHNYSNSNYQRKDIDKPTQEVLITNY